MARSDGLAYILFIVYFGNSENLMENMEKNEGSKRSFKGFSPTQKLVMGFAVIILIGWGLLMLPASTVEGEKTTPLNALFTATSATCVTGLVTYDTSTHWTRFGQTVILVLIQLGGLGFMSFAVSAAVIAKKKIGLKQRELLQEAVNANQLGGIVRLFKLILKGTFICEGVGAVLLAFRFIPMLGVGEGIFYSVFHSVSAFCNGGFDLMGRYSPFSSLTMFEKDTLVNIVIILLIVIGGLGFYVWDDVITCRFKFDRFKLHTKIVAVTTAILLIVPAVLIFFFERKYSMSDLNTGEAVQASLFQSVTLRTAGFNTVDQASLSDSSWLLSCILMVIGGSPGSTAGGIKTTTAAVVILSAVSMIRGRRSVTVFQRRLDDDLIVKVISILSVYMMISFAALMAICNLEHLSVKVVCFEVFSAVGTVGLSMGATPMLCPASKIILIFLMFFGRIGGLSLAMLFSRPYINSSLTYPVEKISVG